MKYITFLSLFILLLFETPAFSSDCFLIEDSVISNSYTSMVELDKQISLNNYSYITFAIKNNLSRRCTNCPLKIQIIETRDEFSKITGIYIKEFGPGPYWTYTDYIKCK